MNYWYLIPITLGVALFLTALGFLLGYLGGRKSMRRKRDKYGRFTK